MKRSTRRQTMIRKIKNMMFGFTLVAVSIIGLLLPAIQAARHAAQVARQKEVGGIEPRYDRSLPVNMGVETLQGRLDRIESKLDRLIDNQYRNR